MPTSSLCPKCGGSGGWEIGPHSELCRSCDGTGRLSASPAEGTPEGVDTCTTCGHQWQHGRDGRHSCSARLVELHAASRAEAAKLRDAIAEHHRQKADDRCIEDDDRLYAAAGLPPCDRQVGDKAAMLKNCERFIDRRCEGGKWPTYAELESQLFIALADAKHWRAVAEAKDRECEQAKADRDQARDALVRRITGIGEPVLACYGDHRIPVRLCGNPPTCPLCSASAKIAELESDQDALVSAARGMADLYPDCFGYARAVLDHLAAGAAPKGETS